MSLPRIIPLLLLRNRALVKTVKFKHPKYIGDPFNAVKIFNEKEVDELIFLDIDATSEKKEPPYDFLKEVASECFMPLCYGGGIRSVAQIKRLIQSGIEKVSINTEAIMNPTFIRQASDAFGSSTIVGAMDIKKNLFGKYHVYTNNGTTNTHIEPLKHVESLQNHGAGELLINIIDRDGTMEGYDFEVIKRISDISDIPVIACGGAGTIDDLIKVISHSHASAAAAGSLFVFHGRHRAVLITYPPYHLISDKLMQYPR